MAIERLVPNFASLVSGWTGTIADIDEDPDTPDTAWFTGTVNTSPFAEIQFAEPVGTLIGSQEFRLLFRKNGGSSTCTATVEVRNNGSVVATPVSGVSITSTTGQIVSFTVDASLFTSNGMNVSLYITTAGGGGSPNNRSVVELGALEWNATVVDVIAKTGSDTSSISIADTSSTLKIDNILGSDTGSLAISETSQITIPPFTTQRFYLSNSLSATGPKALSSTGATHTYTGNDQWGGGGSNTVDSWCLGDPNATLQQGPHSTSGLPTTIYAWLDDVTDFTNKRIQSDITGTYSFDTSYFFGSGTVRLTIRAWVYNTTLQTYTQIGSTFISNNMTTNDGGLQNYIAAFTIPVVTPVDFAADDKFAIEFVAGEPSSNALGTVWNGVMYNDTFVDVDLYSQPYTVAQSVTNFSADATASVGATLPSAPTAGNLLVVATAWDKASGTTSVTPSGFTTAYNLSSTSTSLTVAYKISDGTEQSVTVSGNTAPSGSSIFYAEIDSGIENGGAWEVVGSASNPTTEAAATSWSTGTTAATTDDGIAIGFISVDTSRDVWNGTSRSWSNNYSEIGAYSADDGAGGIFVAKNNVSVGSTASTTFSYSGGTSAADQMSGAILVFKDAESVISEPISGSDTGSLAVTETAQVVISDEVNVSDAASISASETAAVFSDGTATDTGSLAVTESTAILIDDAKSASDASLMSASESIALFVDQPASDSSSLSVTESSAVLVLADITAGDTSSLSISEATQQDATLQSGDAAALVVTDESASFRTIEASDDVTLAVTETAGTFFDAPGSDTGALIITETSEVVIGGDFPISGTETAQLAIAETTAILVDVTSTDTTGLSVTETTDIAGTIVEKTASDTTSLAITDESSLVMNDGRDGADSASLTVTEQAELFKDIAASDTLSLSLNDASVQDIAVLSTEAASLAIDESIQSDLFIDTTDSGSLTITEEFDAFVIIDVGETGMVSVSETSGVVQDVIAPAVVRGYSGGLFHVGVVKVYKNGVWVVVPLKVYRSGTWT